MISSTFMKTDLELFVQNVILGITTFFRLKALSHTTFCSEINTLQWNHQEKQIWSQEQKKKCIDFFVLTLTSENFELS